VLKKWHIHRLSVVFSILFAILMVFCAVKNAAAFDGGVPISDIEMEETRGGFQMPNGNFVYFSMDFMHMDYMAHNDPSTSSTGAQTGILGDQNGLLNNTKFETMFSKTGVSGVINADVTNNVGFTNVGMILGNNNIQQLINNIEINLGFFQVASPDQIKPVLSNWLHLGL